MDLIKKLCDFIDCDDKWYISRYGYIYKTMRKGIRRYNVTDYINPITGRRVYHTVWLQYNKIMDTVPIEPTFLFDDDDRYILLPDGVIIEKRYYKSNNGYYRFSVGSGDKRIALSIHKAMAICFLGYKFEDFGIDGHVVHHKDHDSSNNNIDNLAVMDFKSHGEYHASINIDILKVNLLSNRRSKYKSITLVYPNGDDVTIDGDSIRDYCDKNMLPYIRLLNTISGRKKSVCGIIIKDVLFR